MTVSSRGVGALGLCLLFAAASPRAQERSVGDTADRPGYADSPLTVGHHVLQIEAGWILQRDRSPHGAERDLTVPQLELRAGISRRVELAVWWDGLVRHTGPAPTPASTGGADPRIGGKVTLADTDRGALGVVASASLPLGSDDVSSGTVDPQARLVWTWALSEGIDLGGSFDLGFVSHEGRRLASPAVSATIGHGLWAGVNGFAGFYVEAPDGRSVLRDWSLQAGVTGGIGARAQIDVWAGRRVSGGPASWFLGAGWVQRVR